MANALPTPAASAHSKLPVPNNTESFRKKLVIPSGDAGRGQPTPEHEALLRHAKGLIDISRKEMSKHYSNWDYNDSVFRSRRLIDKEDRNANAKGQTAKMIVPLTFSQVMTFVSFGLATMTQNERFYQFEPNKRKINPLAEPLEHIVERDLRKNVWQSFLVQFLLDIGRFCLGAAEVCYREEYRNIRVPSTETTTGAFGTTTTTQFAGFQQIPVFIGNRIYPLSPYRIFPDTRLPLTRYQEGEFCGSEDMFSMSTLRGDTTNLFNLDQIPKMTEDAYQKRRQASRIDDLEFIPARTQGGDGELRDPANNVKSGNVVITKLVADIIPNNFLVGDEKVLGIETFPVRYIIWFANDRTIVRFEEAYYLHGQFPYIISQFLPDQHRIINEGLSDICDQITTTITWLINAAITSKRSSLDGKFIVDPAGVDIKSLESRSPYIFLRKNASQTGIDRYIKQFQTVDTTATYMQDASQLKELLENITGFSSQMQGQYSTGRRSATQDRVVAQGSSARGKVVLGPIWDSAFEPLGKQLIANNRQEMDFETFQRILGDDPTDLVNDATGLSWTIEDLFVLFKADPITIATSEDFFVFDGTQPSEKAFLAQSLQEILMTLLSNPEVGAIMGYGPAQIRALFDQVYLLRGVTPASLPPSAPPTPPQVPENVTALPQTQTA